MLHKKGMGPIAFDRFSEDDPFWHHLGHADSLPMIDLAPFLIETRRSRTYERANLNGVSAIPSIVGEAEAKAKEE